jgi:hypothetical protein
MSAARSFCGKCGDEIIGRPGHDPRTGVPVHERCLPPMPQHCRVMGDHAGCPGETTLGTQKCQCPCHGGG